MIELVNMRDIDYHSKEGLASQTCCFCRTVTWKWARANPQEKELYIPCCTKCASVAHPGDLPTHSAYRRREAIAQTRNPGGFPSKLVNAATMSEKLNGMLSAERLAELAEAGYVPHFEVDGRAFFQITSVRTYVHENFGKECPGAPFPKIIEVPVLERKIKNAPDTLPDSLLPFAHHLRVVPPLSAMPGIYFLLRDQKVVYVGQAVRVHARVSAHVGVKKFDYAVWLAVPRNDLNETEGAFIRALRPEYNTHKGKLSAPQVKPERAAEILASYQETMQ